MTGVRIAVGIEYDGTAFHGWERQPRGRRTVQACVEAALSRVADHALGVICAGRTDSGVHAVAQVAHFDTAARRSARSWVLGANANLPADASIVWAREVAPDFHARFSARSRHYRYLVQNTRARPALGARRLTWEYRLLDAALMREAAGYLLGEHDFSSFRSLQCQAKHARRTVHRLDVWRRGDLVGMDVVANAFLHHMVRNIAGVLMAVGMGKQQPAWVREVLALRDRRHGGVTAPPDGLYLFGVEYPERYRVPRVTPSGALW